MLRSETAVDAVELFDRASLRECEADENMLRLVRAWALWFQRVYLLTERARWPAR